MSIVQHFSFHVIIEPSLGTEARITITVDGREYFMKERIDDLLLPGNDFQSRYDKIFDYLKLRLKNALTKEGII